MSRSVGQGLLWVGLAAAVFGLATLTVASSASAQEAKLHLEVPSSDISVGDPSTTVDVVVEDVVNLGAFEFDLLYDSSILSFVDVESGPFLASSGRQVRCLDPRLGTGTLRFVCVTLGALPAGPDGSGVLATVTLTPAGPGTSPLRFHSAILARPDGQRIPATLEDTSITIVSVGPPGTPVPTGVPSEATPADFTPAGATSVPETPVEPTPGSAATPTATGASNGGGTNWPLWGSLIGGAAVLVVAGAGVALWSRARRQP